MVRALTVALAVLAAGTSSLASALPPPEVPEEGDSFLRLYALTRAFRAGRPVGAKLLPGGRRALFLRSGPRSGAQSLFELDLGSGETRKLLDGEALPGTGALGEAAAARLERQRITARGVTRFEVSKDGRLAVAEGGGRHYAADLATGQIRVLPLPADALDPRLAPDGEHLAYASGGELHVLELAGGSSRAVTSGASAHRTHGLAEFVAQEEMGRREGYWWSPDSRLLAFAEVDDSAVEELAIGDPARPEREPVRLAYPRAGRANAEVRLGVVPAAGGEVTWVSWDRARYPYLAQVRWEKGGPLFVLVQNRAQTEELLLGADPETGRTATLLVERDPAWLNLEPAFPRPLPGGTGFLWFTERNGGAEVELRGPGGELAASLVPPRFGFVSLAGVDPWTGTVYFVGTRGDPVSESLFRVGPGSEPEEVPLRLPRAAALSASFSEGGGAFVVVAAGRAGPPRQAVFAPDGSPVAELPSVAIAPPEGPGPEIRRVGRQGLPAAVYRPRSFKPGARYPVLVEVYGGPLHLAPLRLATEVPLLQWSADQGFIVVRIVNRGETMRLGRDFERAVKGDFAGPALDDQVEGLRALAAEVPEMDLSRVAISGWSFGGYLAALAVLRRPDVYRAAMAGAPVVDWRDYDTHYTERYLGLPAEAPGAYEKSSLLTYAAGAKRPLLLLHGTADDNVFFLHSLKLADALFRAGRPALFVPLAGLTHLIAEPEAVLRVAEVEIAFLREALGVPEPAASGGGKSP